MTDLRFRLATLRESRAMLARFDFPTTAHDAEIREIEAALAYQAPMLSERVAAAPDAATLLSVDMIGAGTRVLVADAHEIREDFDADAWLRDIDEERREERDRAFPPDERDR